MGFSICADLFAVRNVLGLPIILAGPNLGQSIKKGESLKSFTNNFWAVLQAHCQVTIWPPTQQQTHLSDGKNFCPRKIF